MALEVDARAKVFWGLFLFWKDFADQCSANFEAGRCLGGADVFEHYFIRVQGNTSPILADLREEAMFDGVPL